MKRIISLALVLIVMATLLVGCGGNPVGKYVVKTIDGQNIKDLIDQYNSMGLSIKSAEDFMTLDIKDGGKFTATVMGESNEGTWKQNGDKITLTIDGESQEVTLKGNEITWNLEGEVAILAKQ